MPYEQFIPLEGRFSLPEAQRENLEERLMEWRETKANRRSRRMIISSELELPTNQLKELAAHGADFLRMEAITPQKIKEIIPWDLASEADIREVIDIISKWRQEARGKVALSEPTVKPKEVGRASFPAPLHDDGENEPTTCASPLQEPQPLSSIIQGALRLYLA